MSRRSNPGVYYRLCSGKAFANVLTPARRKVDIFKYRIKALPVRSCVVKQDSTFIRPNLRGLHDLGAHFQFIQAGTGTLLVNELNNFLLHFRVVAPVDVGSVGVSELRRVALDGDGNRATEPVGANGRKGRRTSLQALHTVADLIPGEGTVPIDFDHGGVRTGHGVGHTGSHIRAVGLGSNGDECKVAHFNGVPRVQGGAFMTRKIVS